MISAKIERAKKSYQEDSSHGSLLSNFYYGGFQTKKSKDQKIIRGVAPMIFSGSCEGARMIFFGWARAWGQHPLEGHGTPGSFVQNCSQEQ